MQVNLALMELQHPIFLHIFLVENAAGRLICRIVTAKVQLMAWVHPAQKRIAESATR